MQKVGGHRGLDGEDRLQHDGDLARIEWGQRDLRRQSLAIECRQEMLQIAIDFIATVREKE